VEALFAAMHRHLCRRIELAVAHSPADTLYLIENTSTTLISPAQYRQYCLPVIREYAAIVRAKGRLMVLHMCGHLKALLPDLATLPVAAFEAFTSPTVGNTTLMDGRRACPNTCLIGGTNAALWTRPAPEIIAELDRHLRQLPHRRGLVITSAGMMPPSATPETVRTVCEFVKQFSIAD
jgi:uroporphyrinogen decarboxylase